MIHALALVAKRPGAAPGQRYRLEQWAPLLLRTYGISVHFAAFESAELMAVLYQRGHTLSKAALVMRDTIRRAGVLGRAREYDILLVHREAALFGPAIYERFLARSRIPLIFDFDDAIWVPGAGSVNGIFARLHFPGKTATICRLATAVTVGNDYLAEYAKRHNRDVHVVPSTIDLSKYAVQPPLAETRNLVVTWTGSHSSLADLEVARAALTQLGRQGPVRLRVICDRPPSPPFDGVETEFIKWSPEGEAETVGASHVGIMPLPDNAYTRGKCGLKALQCMATGLPVVVSPVGVNRAIVSDGHNGLVASDTAEWVRALEALTEDPALRRQLGLAGRRTVEERFSAEVGAAAMARVIADIVERPGR